MRRRRKGTLEFCQNLWGAISFQIAHFGSRDRQISRTSVELSVIWVDGSIQRLGMEPQCWAQRWAPNDGRQSGATQTKMDPTPETDPGWMAGQVVADRGIQIDVS